MELEANLVERARGGGEDLDRLIAAVWPEAFRIALGTLHDRGLAEDAAQDACAAMARALPALKQPELFRGWLYKIVVNTAIAAGRKRRTTCALDAISDRGVSDDPTDRLDLYRALATLPIRQRAAVLLHYYAGLNSREIAEACGFPPSTVRFQLMLARRSLKKALTSIEFAAADISAEGVSNDR